MIESKSNPIVCSSIAGKIGGLGVLMHNKAYKDKKINAVYVSFKPTGAKEAIEAMLNLGFRGMGVTMPYKIEVIKYLDKLDETAREIGAVNTIVNDRGVLTGYNTDWIGAIQALEELSTIKGKRVVMLGAGGVARAIYYGLKKKQATVTVFNYLEDEGKKMCEDTGALWGGTLDKFDKDANYDVLINATSVGYNTNKTILKAANMPSHKIVLDVVFYPLETEFIRLAKQNHNRVASGYKMLIYQAIAQDELYLNIKPSYEVMLEALKEKFAQ